MQGRGPVGRSFNLFPSTTVVSDGDKAFTKLPPRQQMKLFTLHWRKENISEGKHIDKSEEYKLHLNLTDASFVKYRDVICDTIEKLDDDKCIVGFKYHNFSFIDVPGLSEYKAIMACSNILNAIKNKTIKDIKAEINKVPDEKFKKWLEEKTTPLPDEKQLAQYEEELVAHANRIYGMTEHTQFTLYLHAPIDTKKLASFLTKLETALPLNVEAGSLPDTDVFLTRRISFRQFKKENKYISSTLHIEDTPKRHEVYSSLKQEASNSLLYRELRLAMAPKQQPQGIGPALDENNPTKDEKPLFQIMSLLRAPIVKEDKEHEESKIMAEKFKAMIQTLHSNGKLWSDEKLAEMKIKRFKPGKYKKTVDAKMSAADIKAEMPVYKSDYSFIVTEGKKNQHNFYVVAPGQVGEGGFGHTRFVQEQLTGTWCLAKFQNVSRRDAVSSKEYKILTVLGLARGEVLRKKKIKGVTDYKIGVIAPPKPGEIFFMRASGSITCWLINSKNKIEIETIEKEKLKEYFEENFDAFWNHTQPQKDLSEWQQKIIKILASRNIIPAISVGEVKLLHLNAPAIDEIYLTAFEGDIFYCLFKKDAIIIDKINKAFFPVTANATYQDFYSEVINFSHSDSQTLQPILMKYRKPLLELTAIKGYTAFYQHIFLMEWFSGRSLASLKYSRSLTLAERIEIIINGLLELQSLHAKKILHRDLTPNNILVETNRKVKLIDYGFSEYVDSDHLEESFLSGTGTPGFMAPETRTYKHEKRMVKNNKFTELYQMGKSIAYFLDLTIIEEDDRDVELVKKEHYKFKNNKHIENMALRKEIHDFLEQMVHEKPGKRPTEEQAIVFFEKIQDRLAGMLSLSRKTALIDIDEYLNLDEKTKKLFQSVLVYFKEIVFVNPASNWTPKQLLLARMEMETLGISVHDDMFKSSFSGPREELIRAVVKKLNSDLYTVRSFFYVSFNKIEMKTRKICMVLADKSREDIREEVIAHSLRYQRRAVIHKVVHTLDQEMRRLEFKYSDPSANARQRMTGVSVARNKFFYHQKKMPWSEIISELDSLEKKTTSIFSMSTNTSTYVKKIKEAVETQYLTRPKIK